MRYFYLFIFVIFLSCSGGGSSNNPDVNNAVYYIDPSAAANGSGTIDSPFKTFSGINFEPGAEYLIKRGTVLEEQITITASGISGDPVVIGAYGAGDDPVIDGSEIVNSWTPAGGNVYSNTLSPTATSGRGNVTANNMIQNFSTGTPSSDQYTIDSTGKIQIYGDPSGKTVRLSRRYFGIHGKNESYITIENIHVKQASLHGIHFEDSNNITVRNCRIEMCGGAFIGTVQAGNGVEFGNSSSDCTVTGCIISEIFDSGITPQTYDSNQSASDFVFSGNIISKCGFAGIEIAVLSNGGKTGSSISNVSVSDTTISECGAGFSGIRYGNEGRGIKIAADSGAGFLDAVIVEDSTVESCKGEGIYINGETGIVKVTRTIIKSNKRDGIAVSDLSSLSIGVKLTASIIRDNLNEGFVYNAVAGKGVEVYNCTFYNNTTIDLSIYSNSGYIRLMNNIYNSGVTHLYSTSAIVNSEIDYNCYYQNSSSAIGWGGSAYNSVSLFNAAYPSFDNNSNGSDPLFNASLTPSSAECKGKGIYISGINTDINGNNFKNPPTLGAVEY